MALTLAETCGCFLRVNCCTMWRQWRCCLTVRRTLSVTTQVTQRISCGKYLVIKVNCDRSIRLTYEFVWLFSSMDIHPSRELVASGQRAGRDRKSQAHVRIWSTESLQTLYVFGMGELDRGVTSVAFSQLVSND